MASDAEVDLLVNASNALRDLERDLDRLINQAEASADPVLIAAAMDQTLVIRQLRSDLDDAVRAAQATAPDLTIRADVDTDDAEVRTRRLTDTFAGLTAVAGAALGPLGGLASGVLKAGAAAGTAAPLLAGVVAAVESIAPASALAASGILTVGLAAVTLKVAMSGVGDAISAAFDPDTKPEDLAKAMEKLAPHARDFVKELAGMRKGFKAIQLDAQNRLFANLDKSLEATAKSTLPAFHGAIDRTADSFNDMARGVATAAQDLGDKGILGAALASSTKSLSLMERIPGQVTTAFGQLAASAGPAMEGLSARVAGVADRISEKLSKAFESGALEKAINVAISNIDQLGRVAENIFSGIGNIIKAVTVDGEGLFGTLEKVSQAFEDLTASKEFQGALKALSETMSVLVKTLLPILSDALKALLPVFEIIAPPIQELIRQLGPQIQDVILKLGPVLEELAGAFAKLVPVLAPILEVGLKLIELVLPILGELFEHLGEVFERFQPIIEQVADNLITQFEPILAKLPGILEQILPKLLDIADKLLPLLFEILVKLQGPLGEFATALADLLVELTPLLVKFLEFQAFLIDKMMPIIAPLAAAIGGVLVGSLLLLTDFIKQFVIPAVQTIVALLEGDFQGAMLHAATFVNNLKNNATRAFEALKTRGVQIVNELGGQVVARVGRMKDQFLSLISRLVADAVARIATIPQGILNVLGGMGSLLFSIGQDIIQGMINGITSKIGGIIAAARAVADAIPSTVRGLLDIGSPSKVMIGVGDDVMAGLLKGIADAGPALRRELSDVALTIPRVVAQPVQGLGAGRLSPGAPLVNVYLGNARLSQFMDYRIDQVNRRDTVIAAQGVRR